MARPSRPSSSKKVSRIASTGGGRISRGARPWMWWGAMGAVVLLGVLGVWFSRDQRQAELAGGSELTPPVVNQDHWHAAYGVFLCDSFAPPIQDQADPKGIHTHADGIIHIHPFVRSAAGDNATLGVFVEAIDGFVLTDTELKLPGGESYKEGDDECEGEPGIVQVKVGDEVVTTDVQSIKLEDGQHITIAFAPEGAELPPPPTADDLERLNPVTEEIEPEVPGQPPAGGIEPAEGTEPPEGGGDTEGAGTEGTADPEGTGDEGTGDEGTGDEATTTTAAP